MKRKFLQVFLEKFNIFVAVAGDRPAPSIVLSIKLLSVTSAGVSYLRHVKAYEQPEGAMARLEEFLSHSVAICGTI